MAHPLSVFEIIMAHAIIVAHPKVKLKKYDPIVTYFTLTIYFKKTNFRPYHSDKEGEK